MGRKSKARERVEQILEGLIRCIRTYGLEGTTLARVAEEAGVQRTIIRHYIGNREDLIKAAADHIVEKYTRDFLKTVEVLPETRRLDLALDYLFLGGFSERPEEDNLISALFAVTQNNENARECLLNMYKSFEDTLFSELRTAFPNAPEDDLRGVAYSIMCIADHNVSMMDIGFPPERSVLARKIAGGMIRSLDTAAREAENSGTDDNST